jgi:hypothetical protein
MRVPAARRMAIGRAQAELPRLAGSYSRSAGFQSGASRTHGDVRWIVGTELAEVTVAIGVRWRHGSKVRPARGRRGRTRVRVRGCSFVTSSPTICTNSSDAESEAAKPTGTSRRRSSANALDGSEESGWVTKPMTELDSTLFAEAVLAALLGQECSVVRYSYAEQLVVGFGAPFPGLWPLRETERAPWLLYSRYGTWRVSDGADRILTDAEPVGDLALQRVRAVLLHQRVVSVRLDGDSRTLELAFENGAQLRLACADDAQEGEPCWALEAPGGIMVEANRDHLTISRTDLVPAHSGSQAAVLHQLVREIAKTMGLVLFEPPPLADAGVDAILTAPNGMVMLMQFKLRTEPRRVAIRAFSFEDDTTPMTSREISVAELTHESMVEEVRRLLTAA